LPAVAFDVRLKPSALLQAPPYSELLLQQLADVHVMLAEVGMAPEDPLSLLHYHPLELFARSLTASDDGFAKVRTAFPTSLSC
jgi:hypothetical protein